MTEQPLVYVAERDERLREALCRVIESECDATALGFSSLAAAQEAAEGRVPSIVVSRWSDKGDAVLERQKQLRERQITTNNAGESPYLLILTDMVSPAKITLAHQSGDAELIPLRPLDLKALGNRIVLLLWGAEALCRRVWGEGSADYCSEALNRSPALRKRLMAA